jgi:hypothetical protein
VPVPVVAEAFRLAQRALGVATRRAGNRISHQTQRPVGSFVTPESARAPESHWGMASHQGTMMLMIIIIVLPLNRAMG